MNVEIGAEAAQFPEKEYINRIAFAVYSPRISLKYHFSYTENSYKTYIKCRKTVKKAHATTFF